MYAILLLTTLGIPLGENRRAFQRDQTLICGKSGCANSSAVLEDRGSSLRARAPRRASAHWVLWWAATAIIGRLGSWVEIPM